MKILILESDITEQSMISDMLYDCEIFYETNVARAINSLGIKHIDLALVDADFSNGCYDWHELTSFLKSLNINYSVFSSNGKVGINNGQKIISIHDIPQAIWETDCVEKNEITY